jgi:glycine betaine/proline transport system ATP-binding protein
MTTAIDFQSVDILFAKGSGKRRDQALVRAEAMLDSGCDRSAIAEETGVVLGVAGAKLSVKTGEISVLMGLSGSGKSTLLRAANGLNRVSRGEVHVRHLGGMVDVASCDEQTLRAVRRKSVAMVFQQFALLPWRTVRDNVGLGLEFQGMDKAARRRLVDEKLDLVGLSEWADRKTDDLSGGMQQRVGLARAFATDADILLMDEPFSALDPLIRSRLQDELLGLQQRVQKTILFVSHDLDEALKLGNQISIMEAGRIIQTGAAQDIILRPANNYVAQFVRHMNPLSVLTGASVMRPLYDLSAPTDQTRYRLEFTKQGGPFAAWAGEQPLKLIHNPADPAALGSGQMAVSSLHTPLMTLIKLVNATGHAVLLVDDGKVCGICGQSEIIAALSRG